ncbi:S1C family serine protease [Aeromicrobium sp. HA]|uniref:S1C family serine protease n=1 Tax=Aeromicrobium sp. HA TaxID=3009077 RepID=UPI0022AF7D8B|nr:trypsin-like peptidase domain-containing protein [Aeromicrobium sp. HA]
MTDQRDPYADRPYVPPTAPQEPQQPAQQAETGWPFSEPRAEETRVEETRVEEPRADERPVDPWATTDDHEPTVSVNEPTRTFADAPADPNGPTGPGGPGGPAAFGYPVASPEPQPRKKRRAGRLVAAATGVILLAGASAAGGAALYDAMQDDSSTSTSVTGTSLDRPASSSGAQSDVSAVADAVLPATVKINVTGGGESGTGTGVVISKDGSILTNNHVVEAAADGGSITVAFNDGRIAKAEIVGRDVATDVAVIKAEGVSDLPAATLGDSKQVKVGQTVVAIGSPFGLESTVTTGIVSALNRPVSPGDQSADGPSTTFPAIQTDAAINPGNSGGPLVNLEGQVIGINSAINTGGQGNGSVGLGFAIPINLVNNVATQILDGDTVEHAQIGVQVRSATGDDQVTTIGAEIGEVSSGGAGDKAGLKAGDIVTKVDGNPVSDNQALVATVRGYKPGDTIELTVLRGDKTQEIEVELGSDGGAAARAQE